MCKSSTAGITKNWRRAYSKINISLSRAYSKINVSSKAILTNLLIQVQIVHKNFSSLTNILHNYYFDVLNDDSGIFLSSNSPHNYRILRIFCWSYLQREEQNFYDNRDSILSYTWTRSYFGSIFLTSPSGFVNGLWHSLSLVNLTKKITLWVVITLC